MNNNRGNNRRRGRGNNNNNRSQGGQQLNRIDSRARGNAPQMLEKYRKLASDAHLNGDRVQAEYYLQFADHYFRVIADTRARQEEQRARPQGERWQDTSEQDDDGLDFSGDSDFPAFDRAPARREERRDEGRREDGRRDEQRRDEPRRDEPRRDEQRDYREPRREQTEDYQPRRETASRPGPFEVRQGDEGEPIDKEAGANPFQPEPRGNRGLRPRSNRFRRDGEARDGENRTGGLDPAMLPPAFGARPAVAEVPEAPAVAEAVVLPPAAEPVTGSDEPAPAPRKRGRPRKNPLPAADSSAEVANG